MTTELNHATRLLEDAQEVIKDRQNKYGSPVKMFEKIAEAWNTCFKAT